MSAEDKITEQQNRLKKINRWPARIDKLRKRKKNPMSESEFCDKHKFHKAWFNRAKNGGLFPRPKAVLKVEKALKAEGV